MFRMVSIEQARKELGRLMEEVRTSAEPLLFTRRGSAEAVLLSREEYERLRNIEESYARASFRDALDRITVSTQRESVPQAAVDEAIRAVRKPL